MKITTRSSYNNFLLEKYNVEIKDLERVNENTTLKELEEILDDDITIVIGDNCSGVDIINLSEEYIEELTL